LGHRTNDGSWKYFTVFANPRAIHNAHIGAYPSSGANLNIVFYEGKGFDDYIGPNDGLFTYKSLG
jgi:hypothetical protein